jgi:hypothetical protein
LNTLAGGPHEADIRGSDSVSSVHDRNDDSRRRGTQEVEVIPMTARSIRLSATTRRRSASLMSVVVLGAFVASLAAPWKWY